MKRVGKRMARAQEAWSVLKQQFCCKQHSIGCIQTTALPFNCFTGFSALASIYCITVLMLFNQV